MSWSLRDENVLVRRFSVKGKDSCVIGNFNLTFRDSYYTKFGRDRIEDDFGKCRIRVLTRDRPECIDHIAISKSFIMDKEISVSEWNIDRRLSDHKGSFVEIS